MMKVSYNKKEWGECGTYYNQVIKIRSDLITKFNNYVMHIKANEDVSYYDRMNIEIIDTDKHYSKLTTVRYLKKFLYSIGINSDRILLDRNTIIKREE